MAGATLDRKLTVRRAGHFPFALATRADDADIRRLLRENPMPGRITISLEREPDYFADAGLPETEKQTIIATEQGRVVCVGSCAIHERFVNGTPARVGYLGGLRLDKKAAGRFDILRRGYQFFRDLQAANPADFYFTSIAADNLPARRFLERDLPGMPAYEFVGEFVTVLLPVGRGASSKPPNSMPVEKSFALDRLDECGRNYRFAECWNAGKLEALSKLGLEAKDFLCTGGAIAALWDQRAFRQTVIRGYATSLAFARPFANLAAFTLGTPRLPAVGSTLAHAFISHLAMQPQKPDSLIPLVAAFQTLAKERGIEFLTLGFDASDPRLIFLRRGFRSREYRSRIYIVRWPGLGGSARELDGRPLGPEVALL